MAIELMLTAEERLRMNEECDALFYSVPRFIQYVDNAFNHQLKGRFTEQYSVHNLHVVDLEWYSKLLKKGWSILDLCSAYDSHLPDGSFKHITGHGMCGPELATNPALDDYFVKDLNESPQLPCPNNSYDAVLCCMGIQYLKCPETIFQEIYRVLKPGGKVLISYTSHCFPEKTIIGWLERTLDERQEMITELLKNAGFENVDCIASISNPLSQNVVSDSVLDCNLQCLLHDDIPLDECPDVPSCDPFYANHATKPAAPTKKSHKDAAEVHLCGKKSEIVQLCDEWDNALASYTSLCTHAMKVGISNSQLIHVEEEDTLQSLKRKRDYLRGVISNFMNSDF